MASMECMDAGCEAEGAADAADNAVQLECMGWMEPPMLMHSQAGMQTPQIGSSPISDSRTPPGSSGSGALRSREASPLDTAEARDAPRDAEDSSPKSTLVVSPPLQLKSLEVEAPKVSKFAEVYFIGTPPVSAELARLDKEVKEVSVDLGAAQGTSQEWLSSPRDALPLPRPSEPSRRHERNASRSGGCAGTTAAQRRCNAPATTPRRAREASRGAHATPATPSRTPSAATATAMRAGRKFREAIASSDGGPQATHKGALPKENRRPAPRPSSKWAWKEQDIRMKPETSEIGRSSPPRVRPEAKVRATLTGVPSARVVAALDGPQGLMSLLGRLAPEMPTASTPSAPSAPPKAFSSVGGDEFHPTDWATQLRQGRPASPMARSQSQGALRRAWSPVGPCHSPQWAAGAPRMEKVSPRVPPPARLMGCRAAEITMRPSR